MRAGRWVRPAVCVLFFLCFALARSAALGLENRDLSRVRTLTLAGECTGQDAADMWEKEQARERPAAFAVWGQRAGVFVENRDLNRSAVCSLITLWGNPELLYPSPAVLEEEDREGCLIDEGTAMALFGSAAPIGSTIGISGEQRVVRGILDSRQPVALVRAGALDGGMNRVTLRIPEGDSPLLATEDFAARSGLFGQWSRPGTWSGLAKALSLLPAAVVLLQIIGRLLQKGFSSQTGRLGFWLSIGLAGAAWFLLLWLTGFRFQLPEDMIPNRWSDFDFWGRLAEEKKEELLQSLAAGKTTVEVEVLLGVMQAGAFGILAALLSPVLPEPDTLAGLWFGCAAGALMAFGAAVFLDPALAHDRALWLTLPVVFGGRYCCRLVGKSGRSFSHLLT